MVTKTAQSVLADLRAQFTAAGIDTPELDARLLVQAALGMSHEDLVLNFQKPVGGAVDERLREMARRRLAREPVSRILGVRSFWNSEFMVSPDTLDPRADSETLVEAVLEQVDKESPLRILDLGTGTGCLLLSLLQELPQSTGVGVDIAEGAVKIARQNAENLSLKEKSLFIITDWSDFTTEHPFDVVISNPPYIADADMTGLDPEVRQYDPYRALSGGQDGLACYREIIRLMPSWLAKNGKVFFEIGATQAESVKALLAAEGFRVLQTVADLAGNSRCLIAEARNCS